MEQSPKSFFVRNTSTNQIFECRIKKIIIASDGEFELLFQKKINNEWVTDDELCSPLYDYSFKPQLQLF